MKAVPQFLGAILFVGTAAAAIGAASPPQAARVQAPPKAIKTTPPKEWPDAATAAKQQKDAENRRLFASTAPLVFTMTANFKAVQSDRSPTSTRTFPATLEFPRGDGSSITVALPIRTRGQVRRSTDTCEFAPIRLEFPKDEMKGTVFAAQHVLKLGTHCRNVKEFEQYVLREYAAYRIFNLLSPQSFRVRLARATYVDSVTKKNLGTKYAMFIEGDEDVAKRMGGRLVTQPGPQAHLDTDFFTLMTLFEYMIGNLDVSIINEHNVKLVQTPNRTVYAVPYDFDYSGLVDASYAVPPPGMKVTTVRDRLYRGPCRTAPDLETFFAKFRAIKPSLAPLYDSLPDFDPRAKKEALSYLDEFYRTIDRPSDVKAAFIDPGGGCLTKGVM